MFNNNWEPMAESTGLEQKQNFLKEQIIEAGVDPEPFIAYMGAVKSEGEQINLDNWTLQELQAVVRQFKQNLEADLKKDNEIQWPKLSSEQATSRSRNSMKVADKVMGSNLSKREKVFYDKDDLWDYEVVTRTPCQKGRQYFALLPFPEVTCKDVQVKKTSGYFFGIGGKYYIELTLNYNIEGRNDQVVRTSEDFDWLRSTLEGAYPGCLVPPLEPTPQFEPENKELIAKRSKELLSFVASLVHHDPLVNNKFTHAFLTLKQSKNFENFKEKWMKVSNLSSLKSVENVQGFLTIEISQKVQELIKSSVKYSKQIQPIYKSIEANLTKLKADLDSITRNSHNLAGDFARFREKYSTLVEKNDIPAVAHDLGLSEVGKRMEEALARMKSMFTTLSLHAGKQAALMKGVAMDLLPYEQLQWRQVEGLEQRHRKQLQNYLTMKLGISRRKQQFFLDQSRKELEEKSRTGKAPEASLAQKEQLYRDTFPKEAQMEEQRRNWLGYYNQAFKESMLYLLREQERQAERKFHKIQEMFDQLIRQKGDE